MNILTRAIAIVAIASTASLASPPPVAKAQSFGFSGPNFSFNVGRYPRNYYNPYYYGGNPYYYGSPYRYRYATPRYRYATPRYNNRSCNYWSNRCAARWGYGNRNYRGCMRYSGC